MDGGLSSHLTMLATADIYCAFGFYSIGLSIPMSAITYSSRTLPSQLRLLRRHDAVLPYVTDTVLAVFGCYSIFFGNFAFWL